MENKWHKAFDRISLKEQHQQILSFLGNLCLEYLPVWILNEWAEILSLVITKRKLKGIVS